MKIKQAIKYLEESLKDGEEDIIVAWWDKESSPVSTDLVDWKEQCEIIDDNMDWAGTHEEMAEFIDIHVSLKGFKQ